MQWSTMGNKIWLSTNLRNFGNHVTVCLPTRRTVHLSAPQAYQCKITQLQGMAIKMQLKVILVGNCIAIRIL